MRGVIDSEDLPLNISRETLQHNSTIEKIKNSVTKRVLTELKKKKDENLDEYLGFWNNFGGVLKEGLCEVTSDHEKLLEVCVFRSALHDKMISFDEYLENCHGEDKTIYYLSGEAAVMDLVIEAIGICSFSFNNSWVFNERIPCAPITIVPSLSQNM